MRLPSVKGLFSDFNPFKFYHDKAEALGDRILIAINSRYGIVGIYNFSPGLGWSEKHWAETNLTNEKVGLKLKTKW